MICPYCNKPAELIDSIQVYRKSYGLMYFCGPCDARVTVGKDGKPKGTMANAELRALRIQVHDKFDKLWKQGPYTRGRAYGWLQNKMGLSSKEAHMSKMNAEQCRKVLLLLLTEHRIN